jgi:hypothetical protein
MFSYIHLLVEKDKFDSVDVFFLIVGHTHASIDQYFSVLARQILKSEFIGSPLALHALLGREQDYNLSGNAWEHRGKDGKTKPRRAKPLLIRKISVIFDMKTALSPILDWNIKYYSIPHRFQFKKYMGVVCMQYSVYSSQKELLPPRPAIISGKCGCGYVLPCVLFLHFFSDVPAVIIYLFATFYQTFNRS